MKIVIEADGCRDTIEIGPNASGESDHRYLTLTTEDVRSDPEPPTVFEGRLYLHDEVDPLTWTLRWLDHRNKDLAADLRKDLGEEFPELAEGAGGG